MADPLSPWTRKKLTIDNASYVVTAARHGHNVSMLFSGEQELVDMRHALDKILKGEKPPGRIHLAIGMPQNLVPKMMFPRQGKERRPMGDREHCRNGHKVCKENTYLSPSGNTVCRPCKRASAKKAKEVRIKLRRGR